MNETQSVSLEIRAFILMNGETIIGRVPSIQTEDTIHIITPAEVITKRNTHGPLGFMLYPWSPNELLAKYDIIISKSFIIGEIVPSNALKKFYDVWSSEELSKLKEFKDLFESQINKMGETYTKHSKLTRDQQQKTQSPIDTSLSDELIELFDEESGWGDPSVTH